MVPYLYCGVHIGPLLKKMVHIISLICLTSTILIIFLRVRGFEVRVPWEFALDPPFAPLFKDFRKEVDHEPREFDMFS